MSDIEYATFITCPYCGDKYEDMCDYGFKEYNDGEKIVTNCGECGKEFEVILNVEYSFSSYQKKESTNE